jgi:molybdopterin-guanine dinucleotide biosynthesis protein A
MARAGNLKMQSLVSLTELNVRLVQEDELIGLDPHLLSFQNVNTPADLEAARALFTERQLRQSGQS